MITNNKAVSILFWGHRVKKQALKYEVDLVTVLLKWKLP